jgi:hypothetical protein
MSHLEENIIKIFLQKVFVTIYSRLVPAGGDFDPNAPFPCGSKRRSGRGP